MVRIGVIRARRALNKARQRAADAAKRFYLAGINIDVGETAAQRKATWHENDRAEAEVDNAGKALLAAEERYRRAKARAR